MILHSDVCTSPGKMRGILVMLCVCQQAMTYKLDFQQERTDRENVIGRFDEEREAMQEDIAKLNVQLAAVKLEHGDTTAQLQQMKELSLLTKNEVRFRSYCSSAIKLCGFWSLVCYDMASSHGAALCVRVCSMCVCFQISTNNYVQVSIFNCV